MSQIVKALSLWEPWASLMRCGAKTIETRSWATSYRGPLLICAAKRWSREQEICLLNSRAMSALSMFYEASDYAHLCASLLFGSAACLVDLVSCIECKGSLTMSLYRKQAPFGDFTPGRFMWITRNLRTFDPFPVTGHQGLFDVELPEGVKL